MSVGGILLGSFLIPTTKEDKVAKDRGNVAKPTSDNVYCNVKWSNIFIESFIHPEKERSFTWELKSMSNGCN